MVNVAGSLDDAIHLVMLGPLPNRISIGVHALKSSSTPVCVSVPVSFTAGATPFTL